MMNFPGIAKFHNIKIPGQKLEAPTPVLIRSAPRLNSEFIFLDTEVKKYRICSYALGGETGIQRPSTHKNIYSKRVIIEVEGAGM